MSVVIPRGKTGRAQPMSYADLMKPDEDWRLLHDAAERRKIQNRLAQRAYRRNMRNRNKELEMLKEQLARLQGKPINENGSGSSNNNGGATYYSNGSSNGSSNNNTGSTGDAGKPSTWDKMQVDKERKARQQPAEPKRSPPAMYPKQAPLPPPYHQHQQHQQNQPLHQHQHQQFHHHQNQHPAQHPAQHPSQPHPVIHDIVVPEHGYPPPVTWTSNVEPWSDHVVSSWSPLVEDRMEDDFFGAALPPAPTPAHATFNTTQQQQQQQQQHLIVTPAPTPITPRTPPLPPPTASAAHLNAARRATRSASSSPRDQRNLTKNAQQVLRSNSVKSLPILSRRRQSSSASASMPMTMPMPMPGNMTQGNLHGSNSNNNSSNNNNNSNNNNTPSPAGMMTHRPISYLLNPVPRAATTTTAGPPPPPMPTSSAAEVEMTSVQVWDDTGMGQSFFYPSPPPSAEHNQSHHSHHQKQQQQQQQQQQQSPQQQQQNLPFWPPSPPMVSTACESSSSPATIHPALVTAVNTASSRIQHEEDLDLHHSSQPHSPFPQHQQPPSPRSPSQHGDNDEFDAAELAQVEAQAQATAATPLHVAVASNNLALLQRLLQYQMWHCNTADTPTASATAAMALEVRDTAGCTPLQRAVMAGRADMAEALLGAGANPAAVRATPDMWYRCGRLAILFGGSGESCRTIV